MKDETEAEGGESVGAWERKSGLKAEGAANFRACDQGRFVCPIK